MKKQIITMVLLLATTAVMAQGEKGRWSVIPRVGMTLSDYLGDDDEKYNSRTGFGGGVEAEYTINKRLGISTGLLYTMQGARFTEWATFKSSSFDLKADDAKIRTQYLGIPLMGNLYLMKGLALKAGIQVDFLLDAKASVHVKGNYYMPDFSDNMTSYDLNDPSAANTVVIPEDRRYKYGIKHNTKDVSVSIPFGVSYEYKNVVLDARYMLGLTKVDDSEDHDDIKNSTFLFTIGYRFNM